MNNFIKAIKQSLSNKNYYSALFISLSVPDICGKLEDPERKVGDRYIKWFEKYMSDYKGFLSGQDCYNLRCSLFHEGSDRLDNAKIKDTLEHFIFLNDGPHLNLFEGNIINGKKETFLQLNVEKFCKDISNGLEVWTSDMNTKKDVLERIEGLIRIHEKGYVHKGAIKFGGQ